MSVAHRDFLDKEEGGAGTLLLKISSFYGDSDVGGPSWSPLCRSGWGADSSMIPLSGVRASYLQSALSVGVSHVCFLHCSIFSIIIGSSIHWQQSELLEWVVLALVIGRACVVSHRLVLPSLVQYIG